MFDLLPNSNIFTIQNILIYVLAINLITFFAMFIDKRKAEKGAWRIKEGTLFTLVLLGGGFRWNSRYVFV